MNAPQSPASAGEVERLRAAEEFARLGAGFSRYVRHLREGPLDRTEEAWMRVIARAGRASQPPEQAGMVEALRWYGEQARLARLIHSEGDAGRHALAADGGRRATAALTAAQAGTEK